MLAFACALAAADKNRHVIVVSLDGFPAYALRDPNVPFPVLRRLMAEGASADAMKPVNPTVTWPNHTAIISGVNVASHGVIYNGLPVRPGDRQGAEGRAVGSEDRAGAGADRLRRRARRGTHHRRGRLGRDLQAADHRLGVPRTAERRRQDRARDAASRRRHARTSSATGARPTTSMHDDVWTRAAVHIIEKHKPNLLMYHLLLTDSVQHSYGARSLAANTALILADRQLQRILDAVDRAGIRDSTTIFVVSDHGFKAYHHVIHPNALLRAKGAAPQPDDNDGWVISEGGTAMVYVTREERRKEVLAAFREPIPGVSQVIAPEDYAKWGYPKVTPNGRMSDLVLAAANDYAFDGAINGEVNTDVPAGASPGAHGYLNTDPDMDAILVAWGAGIKRGARTAIKPNVDVAATIAQLLGVEFPGIQGKPLTEFLK